MIGRWIFENLFLFSAIRAAAPRDVRPDPTASPTVSAAAPSALEYAKLGTAEKIARFRAHMELHRQTWGGGKSFPPLKKFAKTYLRAFAGADRLVDAVMRARSYDEAAAVLEGWGGG